ncbi:divalent-cation tolerance protein CutA [bacterium]|nr:divalent-cation tolerance protein CutA [bacterium]
METGFITVLVTAGNAEAAAQLARALVEERLAACGNVIPNLRSIYRWRGAVHDEGEALLILKTRASLFEKLRARVVELHSYEVPEVVALEIQAGHGPFLDWLADSTGPEQ